MRFLASRLFLAAAVLPLLVACSQQSVEDGNGDGESSDALSEASTPRKGNTITSPSVSANKDYWGARTIQFLVDVRHLTAEEAAVARRADGIIANSPPNGKLGVDELALLETNHAQTLFPAERAAIPKLWATLEIGPGTDASPAAPKVTRADSAAYSPTQTQLPISSLTTPELQTLASRIQLTENSDANAQTISGTDIEKAYKNKASYLPAEVTLFKTLSNAIANAAPRLPSNLRRVEVQEPTRAVASLFDVAGTKLNATTSRAMAGAYTFGQPIAASPINVPQLEAKTALTLEIASGATVIVLNRKTGADAVARNGSGVGDESRVEVWSNGTRTGQFDVKPTPTVVEQIPIGHDVKFADQIARFTCTVSQNCTYVSAAAGSPAPHARLMVPSGSYYVADSPAPGARLDLFESGLGVFVEGSNERLCLPANIDRASQKLAKCHVYTPGQATIGITLGAGPAADSPALGSSTVSARPLYPN